MPYQKHGGRGFQSGTNRDLLQPPKHALLVTTKAKVYRDKKINKLDECSLLYY